MSIGEGKPLLLCHGFLSSAEEFGGRFSELAAHRRLIIPDLPGSGESPPLPGRHTADALAASLEAVLTQLDVTEFDLAGLCLGACVASALARRCGARVGRLVLHTPLIDPSLIRRRYRTQVRVLTVRPLWHGVVALSRSRTVSDLYKRFVIEEGDVDHETSEVNFANQRRADSAAAREWLRDGMKSRDLAFLRSRSAPTLVIVAARDQVIDVDGLRRLLAGCPNASLFVDEEQGHGWNQAAVRRQLDIMLDFFSGSAPHVEALEGVA
ncbi:MAG: alpha/beta fold hydrolase [Candidatus Dormibacteraeota bacterium]|nr:alpha/beta fold hydrolase [Candidatus Dormibacteraeota bacterium]